MNTENFTNKINIIKHISTHNGNTDSVVDNCIRKYKLKTTKSPKPKFVSLKLK